MKRLIAMMLMISLVAALMIGCTGTNAEPGTTDPSTQPTATKNETDNATPEPTSADETLMELTLPVVDEPLTVTCFSPISGDATAYGFYDNLGDTPTAQYFFEKTGITIEFTHPPSGQENEQFNLLISSNELPDIIASYVGSYYEGGVEGAILDGVIIDVEDLVMKYAPQFQNQCAGKSRLSQIGLQ